MDQLREVRRRPSDRLLVLSAVDPALGYVLGLRTTPVTVSSVLT